MGRKRTYLKAGLIMLALAFLIIIYPVASYYFGIYLGSNHTIHKPGSSFTYAGG